MANSGKIWTVRGGISPETIGITYTHEHLCLDFQVSYLQPPAADMDKTNWPFTLPHLGWIRQNPYYHYPNLFLNDVQEDVLNEVITFKTNGGSCIVENTNRGILRDVTYLKHASERSDVHIVAGAGYYVGKSHPVDMDSKSVECLRGEIVSELTVGCDGTDIRAGVIGELGCMWPLMANERKVLQAAAAAQIETGAPVIIHPGRNPKAPEEILRVLQEAGGDVSRTVISHLDRTMDTDSDLLELASLGCYCEYDMFGIEVSHYQLNDYIDMPSDAERIRRIRVLVEEGFGHQVVIGHDIHTKHRLVNYGGHGYSHILVNVVPKMLKRGLTQQHIDDILIHNPRRWLTWK